MAFRLSQRSLTRLIGVHPDLVRVVHRALTLTPIDFMITEGLRTKARQAELFAAGASKTMNSRHLSGHAIDFAAIVGGEVRWDWPLYSKIAQAFKEAAQSHERHLKVEMDKKASREELTVVSDIAKAARDAISKVGWTVVLTVLGAVLALVVGDRVIP